jgi:hypothetical protein
MKTVLIILFVTYTCSIYGQAKIDENKVYKIVNKDTKEILYGENLETKPDNIGTKDFFKTRYQEAGWKFIKVNNLEFPNNPTYIIYNPYYNCCIDIPHGTDATSAKLICHTVKNVINQYFKLVYTENSFYIVSMDNGYVLDGVKEKKEIKEQSNQQIIHNYLQQQKLNGADTQKWLLIEMNKPPFE